MIIFLTKLITKVMNLLGYGATTLPGRIALFFKRDILAKLSQGVKVIVITGTNGKTTSARIVEEGLKEAGKSYFINRSGANLITGITTSFILNSTNSGKCTKEYAVIECDENAFRTVSKYLKAKVVLVTNVFRDQLDRYGEVSHTLSAIQESVNNLPEATLVINGDCSLTNTLKRENTVTYGVSVPLDQTSAVRDGTRCIHCKHQLEYDYFTYAHLGKYRCPGCGYCRETPDYNVTDIVETTPDSSTVMLNGTTPVKINLGGVYNIYNGIGALAALVSLGIDRETALHALERFSGGDLLPERQCSGRPGHQLDLGRGYSGGRQDLCCRQAQRRYGPAAEIQRNGCGNYRRCAANGAPVQGRCVCGTHLYGDDGYAA